VLALIAFSVAARSEVSTKLNVIPYRVSTLSARRYVPPYVLSVTTTWSPCERRAVIALMADSPDAYTNAPRPPSIAARFASSVARVGFCVRAYSYPLCLPSSSWTYVDV
jgi:hypothetical protein